MHAELGMRLQFSFPRASKQTQSITLVVVMINFATAGQTICHLCMLQTGTRPWLWHNKCCNGSHQINGDLNHLHNWFVYLTQRDPTPHQKSVQSLLFLFLALALGPPICLQSNSHPQTHGRVFALAQNAFFSTWLIVLGRQFAAVESNQGLASTWHLWLSS